jgi:hypothetical protein
MFGEIGHSAPESHIAIQHEKKTLSHGQRRVIGERENRKEIEQQKMMPWSKNKANHEKRFKARDNQRSRLAVASEFERNRCSRLCLYLRPLPAGSPPELFGSVLIQLSSSI